jgi:mycothiol synthase
VNVPTWTIDESPVRELPDELLAELYAARAALHQEATPDDPRKPLEAEIAELRNLPPIEDGVVLVARDAARGIAGVSSCFWERLPGVDHVLFVEVEVLPAARRHGLGRMLLELSARVAADHGLRMIIGSTRENVPSGGAFCSSFGAEKGMVGQENRLDLHSLDRDLVDRWIADGPIRAPGYKLMFVAGRTPPELTARVATVLNVMNTAPREDLDMGDTHITPDLVREFEDSMVASGHTRWAIYAVDRASGAFVGLSDISIRPGTPDRVFVGDTGVDPAHRGNGLGKWLKAEITRRILADLPEVRWVITRNAGSNDAMLAINTQLGFRTTSVDTTWQIATERLRSSLADAPAVARS